MSAPIILIIFIGAAYLIYFIANRSWESPSDEAANKSMHEYKTTTSEEESEEEESLLRNSPIYSHLPTNIWFDPNK